jgi:glucose/arabinose dehydrogenase
MPPRIVFVPMHNGEPVRAVNWNDPTAQWEDFVTGFQDGGTIKRSARPTGITVGPDGSLYFADDLAGGIYRIRPR